jgi:two-component system sensor histidine kinase RegB
MRGRSRDSDGPGGGLGLGFFIAKTLLERSGASLSLENRVFPESGAIVTVRWPRSGLELNVNPGGAAVSDASGKAKRSASLVSGGADN